MPQDELDDKNWSRLGDKRKSSMMEEHRPEEVRRASASMYDPARDLYMVSDGLDLDRSAEHDARCQPAMHNVGHEIGADRAVNPQKEDLHPRSNLSLNPDIIIAPGSTTTAPETEGGTKPNESSLPLSRVSPPDQARNRCARSPGKAKQSQLGPSLHSTTNSLKMPEQDGKSEVAGEREHAPPGNPRMSPDHDVDSRENGHPDKKHKMKTSPNEKKRKLAEDEPSTGNSKTPLEQPVSKRKRMEERHQKTRKRGKTPPAVYSRRDRSRSPTTRHSGVPKSGSSRSSPEERRRDALRKRSLSPLPRERSPTPEAQARQRKRPGGGARLALADREALRRRQEERERAQQEEVAKALRDRGVSDVVRQHYNAVPERGREWRKRDSKIKGLRSYNNWIKSTLIQKFSPDEEFLSRANSSREWAENGGAPAAEDKKLLIVDLGCGKGGDLGKWELAPQPVELYVGLDAAEISIEQARERYHGMRSGRGQRGRRGYNNIFHAEFHPKDCFGEWLGEVPIIQQVGIDSNVGPGGSIMSSRWGGGGFDVVASMFTMHYAFESEKKARQMLQNVAGVLKKGGRFLGVGPNSDAISAKVVEYHKCRKEREEAIRSGKAEAPEDGEVEDDMQTLEWGNSIYRVRFPGQTPEDGVFRPPYGWKYSYFMEEAVEEIPEYVVPWEAFRALTQEYNLELQYRKSFIDIWKEEKDNADLGPLSERMGVRARGGGPLLVTEEELEAASFYHAFCFYKV